MTSVLPSSIPDSQLGLSQSEIHILRQHQQIALSQNPYAHTTSSRGRGHARTSASTSRAASAASSGQGRLVLDPGSLAVLGQHFERLMSAIQNRVQNVCTVARRRSSRARLPSPKQRTIAIKYQICWRDSPSAHGTDSDVHHQPILTRRRSNGSSRRRNCAFPRDSQTDWRAGDGIRQSSAH